MSEEGKKENFFPDAREKVKVTVSLDLPRVAVGNLERFITMNDLGTRVKAVEQLILWAQESIDPDTGRLPDLHPTTGRTKEEVLKKPTGWRGGLKASNSEDSRT